MLSETHWQQSKSVEHFNEQSVALAAEGVRRQLGIDEDEAPVVGVILGSGLGAAADRLRSNDGKSIAYKSIPGMPCTLVAGHTGRLIVGRIAGVPVAFLQGRVHSYEGHSTFAIEFGTRLLHAMGVRTMLITNAAGGIRSEFQPGDLMVISSHLRPLAAIEARNQSERDEMQKLLWNEDLRQRIRQIKSSLKIHQGVYAMMTGPCYETPAEIRMMQKFGADAVGMSTVPEALTAASLGMRVLGVSCITNIAAGLSTATLSHADVTATATSIEIPFSDWLWDVIRIVSSEPAKSPASGATSVARSHAPLRDEPATP